MKKLASLFTVLILIFAGFQTSEAAPLIFKTEKLVETPGEFELAIIDTAKYKSVRIGIYLKNTPEKPEDNTLFVQTADDGNFIIIEILNISPLYKGDSYNLENPPAKTRIAVKGRGTYVLYVWGS